MEVLQKLKNYPFIFLIIPLIAGLLAGHFVQFDIPVLYLATIAIIPMQVIVFRVKHVSFLAFQGIIMMTAMMLMGMLLMESKQQNQQVSLVTNLKTTNIVKVLDHPVERTNSYRTRAVVLQHDSVDMARFPKVIVYLYFSKDSASAELVPGDVLLFSSYVQRVKNSGNPNEFDYQSYLERRNILHQSFVKQGEWKVVEHHGVSRFLSIGNQCKSYARNLFQKFINEHAIVSAMLLGERDELDRQMKSTFSEAGIMHILAISGLHVGLILLFLNTTLFFLSGSKYLKVIRILIVVLCLWAYAWITGFSPSVVRATMMFSFFTLAQLTSRKANSYNILAFTAFVMLILNPYNVFEVGFQLSFIAVLSILFFYPKIYRLIKFKQIIADKGWQIISVSLAAQMLTFPLTIYYFHQFSTWFLLANLIAIPVVFLIVLLSLFLLLVSQLSFLANLLGLIINSLITFLIAGTQSVNNLPGNLLVGLHLNMFQLLILYSILGLSMMFLVSPRKRYVFMITGLVIILLNIGNALNWKKHHVREFMVFNVSGTSAYSLLENGQVFCFISDTTEKSAISYATDNYFINKHVWQAKRYQTLNETEYPTVKLFNKSHFLQFTDKKIIILNDDISKWQTDRKLQVDYLIVTGAAGHINLEKLNDVFSVQNIVIDSSVDYFTARKVLDENSEYHFRIHIVREDGAFRLIT